MANFLRSISLFILTGFAFIVFHLLLIMFYTSPSVLSSVQNTVPPAIATPAPTLLLTETAVYSYFLPFVNNRYQYRELLFVSDRNDRIEDLYLVNSDGKDLFNLTNTLAHSELYAAWSPDGNRIAFGSHADGEYGIYTIDADGSNLTRLVSNLAGGVSLSWSPDGTKLAFDALIDNQYDIYMINVDGTEMTNLSTNPARDTHPYWSPDGRQVAFWTERHGLGDIYVVDPSSGEPINLTDPNENDTISYRASPWAPDSASLLFSSYRDGNWEIYLTDRDGTVSTNLTQNPGSDSDPSWSPDGTRIIYSTGGDGRRGYSLMEVDGTNQMLLLSVSEANVGFMPPVWSPDGSQIAFTLLDESQGEVYIVNRDGSGLRNLTMSPFEDFAPTWRPLATVD